MARYKVYENPSNGYREKVKDGFNWPVLFLGPIWYFFNSMFGIGIAWFLVALFFGAFTFGIGAIIVWIIAGFRANGEKEKKFLQQGWKFIGYDTDITIQSQTLD